MPGSGCGQSKAGKVGLGPRCSRVCHVSVSCGAPSGPGGSLGPRALTSQSSVPRVVLGLRERAVSALLSGYGASHREIPSNAPDSIQGHCECVRSKTVTVSSVFLS